MKSSRRMHSREFKIEAGRLVTQKGLSVSQAARDLGIHPTLLGRWKKQLAADGQHAFPGKGHLQPMQEELALLKRENAKLKMERDILKNCPVRVRSTFWTRNSLRSSLAWPGGCGRLLIGAVPSP